jgi:hypothetical protein
MFLSLVLCSRVVAIEDIEDCFPQIQLLIVWIMELTVLRTAAEGPHL